VPFDVQRTAVRNVPVLAVAGELDLLTAPRLALALERLLAEGPSLVAVDLSATTFIDSSGARQVARSARSAGRAGATLQVICPPGNHAVRLVFDLLDLEALVPVLPSTDLIGQDSQP
jgi:anti-anti-sigma factor